MSDRLERRTDLGGCGCLECRGVQTVATRRTVGDIVFWLVGFLRSTLSVPTLFLALVGVQVMSQFASLSVTVVLSAVSFVGAMFARGYVATLVFGALSNRQYTARTATVRTIRRLPAVVATWIITFATVMLFGGVVGFAFSSLSFFGLAPESLLSSIAAGSFSLVVFSGLSIALVVKFVLATEAAVIGGYGPIASHRVSWQLVSFRHRAPIALFGFLFSFSLLPLFLGTGSGFGSGLVSGDRWSTGVIPATTIFTAIVGYAFSCFVFAHLYIRRILEY